MLVRVCGVNLGLKVETGGGGSKGYLCYIFFHALLELRYAVGGSSSAYEKNACGERVKSAGMTHLEFPDTHAALYGSAYPLYGIERCPSQRLVDTYDFSADKIH